MYSIDENSGNIEMPRGDSAAIPIRITNNGDPVDISDYSLVFTVKEKLTDADMNEVFQVTITEHINPTNGETILKIPYQDTEVNVGKYHAEMRLDKGDTRDRFWTKFLIIKNAVTQN